MFCQFLRVAGTHFWNKLTSLNLRLKDAIAISETMIDPPEWYWIKYQTNLVAKKYRIRYKKYQIQYWKYLEGKKVSDLAPKNLPSEKRIGFGIEKILV